MLIKKKKKKEEYENLTAFWRGKKEMKFARSPCASQKQANVSNYNLHGSRLPSETEQLRVEETLEII